MKAITGQWLEKAKEDIDVIERLIDAVHLSNMVAFHSQQAIEKCFKAVIEEFEIGFIKVHNLEHLYELIRTYVDFEIELTTLIKLDKLYIDSRYPTMLGIFPNGMPDKDEAEKFYLLAKEIFNNTSLFLNK